jgi:cytochrome c oxidase subunit II
MDHAGEEPRGDALQWPESDQRRQDEEFTACMGIFLRAGQIGFRNGGVPGAVKTIGHVMIATILKRAAFLVAAFGAADFARADTPLSYMRTFGPAADPVTRLNYGLLTISVTVVLLIGLLVLWGSLRKRSPPPDADGRLPVGPARGGMAWIYIGVGISTLVLLGSAVWTLLTLSAVAAPQNASGVDVDVIAHQWWWEVRYTGAGPSQTVVTANEIHIPVGKPVRLKLTSDDVIHSFWVPRLAGKTDVIPGQTNYAWLQADRPGDYLGECGEYCGAQHAHMALHVIADNPAAFDAWRRRQLGEGAQPQTPQAVRGMQVFMDRCSKCHAVRGTRADGRHGPDLTHLMSRGTIAAGMLPNTIGSLSGWVADAQAIKPGACMPTLDLSPEDLHAVVDYLETLN